MISIYDQVCPSHGVSVYPLINGSLAFNGFHDQTVTKEPFKNQHYEDEAEAWGFSSTKYKCPLHVWKISG